MENKKDLLASKLEKNFPKSMPVNNTPSLVVIDKEIQDDYEFSRSIYKDLINTGMRSLDVLSELAKDTEHPRAFEVLSQSIKHIGDTTDKLMDLQKSKRSLNKDDAERPAGEGSVTNNNVFVGSTSDLQRMIMTHNEEKLID